MTSINPINVNTSGIGANYIFNNNKPSVKDEEKAEQPKQQAGQQASVNPDKVFDYMANSAAALMGAGAAKGVYSIDPSKYVDDASKARIEGFVKGFEGKYAEGLAAVTKELPNMSDGAKQQVVLNQLNAEI